MSWPGSRYYPSQVLRSIRANGKFFVIARRSSSPQRSMKYFYCLQPIRGMCLHTAKSTRRYGEISPLAARATLSAFTSAICEKSCTRQLPMLPLPFDLSGKLDTALKYKQINKSQQSDPLRLLFFFFCCKSLLQWEVHLLLSSCQVPPFTKGRSCPLAVGGIFTWSRFPDLKKQAALAAPGTVPLLSDEKIFFFQVLDCSSHSGCLRFCT